MGYPHTESFGYRAPVLANKQRAVFYATMQASTETVEAFAVAAGRAMSEAPNPDHIVIIIYGDAMRQERNTMYNPDGDSPFATAMRFAQAMDYDPREMQCFDWMALDEFTSCARSLLSRPEFAQDEGLMAMRDACELAAWSWAVRGLADAGEVW